MNTIYSIGCIAIMAIIIAFLLIVQAYYRLRKPKKLPKRVVRRTKKIIIREGHTHRGD